ncbi:MAG: DEAD/DEAH box helicase [Steroidobacteraceae bacterium]
MQPVDPAAPVSFADLGLSEPIVLALKDVGYESPTPIQAATIPVLLHGADLLGQANTGTGKTAAFAVPVLSRLELARRVPQALVLVPTRELAIQVAEAFQKYAAHLPGFHVLPIYGGQSYTPQFNALQRGPHVVVGTPGRIIDHLERGTLALDAIRCVVLDEADEMLAMGFIDAIDTILARTPPERQVALFSATLPAAIRQISQRHLRAPRQITIGGKTTTAANIHQRYWLVSGMHKLDALTRILEVESFEAMLVFVRTKQSTVELAERLIARGFAAAALNGDIQQSQRERTVAQLKSGAIDILVATDVAARGLDVDRIGHVVNFDVPHDTESYVHRIGRTGRAGRNGEAILFVAPRERNMLRAIERATRQPIEAMNLPTLDDVNQRRIGRFKQRITDALNGAAAGPYRAIVEDFVRTSGADVIDVAAALASLAQGRTPLVLSAKRADAEGVGAQQGAGEQRQPGRSTGTGRPRTTGGARARFGPQRTYRLEVGRAHGVQPGNIIGAIANEADLDGSQINGLDIQADHSFVRLPADLLPEVLERLQRVRVRGRELAPRMVERRGPSHPKKAKPHRGRVK